MIESIGLSRERVFIANLIKHRPPDNRDPSVNEIARYTPYLDRQIAIVSPKVIVTLGRFSMAYFLGDGPPISEVHGKPQIRDGRTVIPMYHPAAALYRGNLRPVLAEDFARIPEVITSLTKTPA